MRRFTMESAAFAWLLIGLLLLSMNVVHAEGGCPPGYYPYPMGSAQGQPSPQGCAPIPGYNINQQQPRPQQSPPPKWVNHWGAIATALPQGIVGVSTNLFSDADATQSALSDCRSKGGTNCKIELSYGNQCIAMAVGNPGYSVDLGPTPTAASEKTLKGCTDGGFASCHVIYTGCSLPVRIR